MSLLRSALGCALFAFPCVAQCLPFLDPLPLALNARSYAVLAIGNDDVVYGGSFDAPGEAVARWDGSQWAAMGAGLNDTVFALAELPNGDIVAGGAFTASGATATSHVARWDGTQWHAMGAGLPGNVAKLLVLQNGDLLAGGSFLSPSRGIARWDGSTWQAFGGGTDDGAVRSMIELPDGDVVVTGTFTSIGGTSAGAIARWDGSQWHAYGTGANGFIADVVQLANGDLVIGGGFSMAGGVAATLVARWDGTQWQAMGNSFTPPWVLSLEVINGIDVLAGGSFNLFSGPFRNLGRWQGTTWVAIVAAAFPMAVEDMARTPDGTIYLAGGGSPHALRIDYPCPTTIAVPAPGCAGASGMPSLTHQRLPRINRLFKSVAEELPNGLAVCAISQTLMTPLSLASLFPSPIDCELVVDPLALDLLSPVNGSANWDAFIPADLTLLGQTFHHQVVGFELDATGIVEVTTTNALSWTIGGYYQ